MASLILVGCGPSAVTMPPTAPTPTLASMVPLTHGSASITLSAGQGTHRLDRLGDATFFARYDPEDGAQAEWTDSAGRWSLTVLLGPSPASGPPDFQGWIQQFTGEPPLFAELSGCDVTVTTLAATRVAGVVNCRGLRWVSDYDAAIDSASAEPMAGLPAFDALIQFSAEP